MARTWAARLAVLLAICIAYRYGYRRGAHSLPAVVGRESQPEMIGTRHPWWEIERVIATQPCRRRITEVILHHTWDPTAAQYAGEPTVEAILRFHARDRGWHNIAYHYIIGPDGTIWLGRPLSQVGTHTQGHNDGTIGVCLIINADVEQPSEVQIKATAIVLRTLFDRFGLSARRNFAPGHGFHRDYADKTCPGTLITKARVLRWLQGSP
ncbi:MAG: N-acetylmuramoyl-L-alanine amidase [Armatimonadetes bacterium]|nr:N-acetylmuramoyl-L-alanine amidase [Armatimonadota bacterium]